MQKGGYILDSSLQIQSKRLCILTSHTNYIGCVILCVQKVLPSRVLLLEGQDGQTWKDHVHNCVMYIFFT
jgi:hypothetical protein